MERYDLIKAEVHRMAMVNISKEMAITLMRTSGSIVVTEAKDFSTSILDVNNEQLAFSGWVNFHVPTSYLGVEAVLRNYTLDEIRPGDCFLCNDPHTSGAIHQGDIGVVMPYFYNGKLVAWGYVNEHLADVGGSAVCGFAPEAKDCYSETLRFSGIRAVQNGKLTKEWEQFIARNVRVPNLVLNDLRSMIAANNVGQKRIIELLDKMGLEEFTRYNEINKDYTEQAVRNRIAALPDGVYESEEWVEYDARGEALLFNFKCKLEVNGDQMAFRFTGDPQTDCFINGAKPSMLGQTMTTLLCQFFWDIPVNAGIWRPLEIDLGPEGTIVNSIEPAPVTQSHMETGMRVNKVVCDLISQAASLSSDPVVRSRIAGAPSNGLAMLAVWGQYKETGDSAIVFPMATSTGAPGGAQTYHDGLDTYGPQCATGAGMPDVEIEESTGPIMTLWRRVGSQSGGPGQFRGGQGIDTAFAFVGTEKMIGVAFNSVAELPSRGAFGGYPASASNYTIIKKTNLQDLLHKGVMPTPEHLDGQVIKMPAKTGSLTILEGDIFHATIGGGGGIGDPLLRSAEKVVKDVADGFIGVKLANDLYGVVVNESGIYDSAATIRKRSEIRQTRIGKTASNLDYEAAQKHPGVSVLVDNGTWHCAYCGHKLGSISDNWRRNAVMQESKIEEKLVKEFGMQVRRRVNPGGLIREHFCPSCASALVVDVTVEGRDTVPAPRLKTNA